MTNEAAERLRDDANTKTFATADDLIRDLVRRHTKKELIEVIVAQTQAAVDAGRSAGAATIDVDVLAKALSRVERSTDVGWPDMDERDLARLIAAEYARLLDATPSVPRV